VITKQQDTTLIDRARMGQAEACEQMIKENSALIWSVARRYFGRGAEAEDLYQLGCIGFIKAINGYDTAYGTQFSTYAVPKIAGEIRRFLRDDGQIKVSRSLKERALVIKRSQQSLSQSLGREPFVSEIAEDTGLTVEEIAAAQTATGEVASLYDAIGDGLSLEQTIGTDDMEEGAVSRIAVREAVHALPEQERAVIALRFFRDMTQTAAAKVLGVSQVQVSRLERRALVRLRSIMKE